MSEVIDCPACSHRFPVAEERRGQEVECPACGKAFLSSPQGIPTPVVNNLDLGPDEGPPAGVIRGIPPPPPPLRPVVVESSETPPRPGDSIRRSGDCPECGAIVPRSARYCRECGASLTGDERDRKPPWERGLGPRRDVEPHRGSLVLILGILSLVLMFLPMVGLPCGITAWVMGQSDMRKMREHAMDPEGLTSTQAGHVCGIIGSILSGIMLLGCAATFLPALMDELF